MQFIKYPVGETPPTEPFTIPDDLGLQFARQACTSIGGSWNEETKQCFPPAAQPGTPPAPMDPVLFAKQVCASIGGTWDEATGKCFPPGQAPPPPPKSEGLGTAGWVSLAALAFGFGWLLSSGKKRR